MLLTGWGHEVLALSCDNQVEAAEILEHIRFLKFDVALVGFKMPGMLGTTLAVHIKKISPSTKIIIIIEPVPPEEADALRRRGVAFKEMYAPFEPDELLQVLTG
jgi:DNA-binding NtrC family response regulator